MTKSTSAIAFDQLGLGGVLKSYRIAIPPNQREYSWTEREITKLLEDFAKAISDNQGTYFLGTVVTIPTGEGQLEVVDGQQRLATTAILLGAIRNALQPIESLVADSIEHDFLSVVDREKRERVPKLTLNLVDNEFFRSRLSPPQGGTSLKGNRKSHERLQGAVDIARDYIAKVLAPYDPKDRGDVLNKWVGFLEFRALVVLLRVPNDSDAFKMFETLNDRGLKTSQADLVKNYLFGRSGSRMSEVEQKWSFMRGQLQTISEEDLTMTFLRHALITLIGFVREPDIFDSVQNHVKAEPQAVTFAASLESLANEYAAIHNPEHEKWNTYPDNVRRAVEALNLLDIRPLRSLMLAVASKFSPAEASKAYQSFIAWGARLLTVGGTRSGSVELPLAAAAQKAYSGVITTAAQLRIEMKNSVPSDEQFRAAFESLVVSKASLARYYLRSLEMAAKKEKEPWLIPNDDKGVINLEHVLPKKPMGNWKQFDEESLRFYTHRLGNLALLQASGNSNLGSDDFNAKKQIYSASPYELTRHIADVGDWTPDAITERQKVLAGLALMAWPF